VRGVLTEDQPNILPYVDALRSPNTSSVTTHFTMVHADSYRYTFTELASGGDLMSFLHRHPKIVDFHARLVIRQVVHGLKYLHSKGVVHRDLKPENILLAYSPRILYHRVMIADFGASSVPQRSRMTSMVGTEDYQAPWVLYSLNSDV
jgi:calcium/calmodulin-dependent protein kinase I